MSKDNKFINIASGYFMKHKCNITNFYILIILFTVISLLFSKFKSQFIRKTIAKKNQLQLKYPEITVKIKFNFQIKKKIML